MAKKTAKEKKRREQEKEIMTRQRWQNNKQHLTNGNERQCKVRIWKITHVHTRIQLVINIILFYYLDIGTMAAGGRLSFVINFWLHIYKFQDIVECVSKIKVQSLQVEIGCWENILLTQFFRILLIRILFWVLV